MTALLVVTALVLVARAPRVLPAAAGGTDLKPPQNAEVSITDDTFVLQWRSGSEPGRELTFSVAFQTPEMNNWVELPGCQSVTTTNCDFSSLNINIYEEIKLRVRAEEGNNTSPWCELDSFIPFQEARLGPPKVHLEAEDRAIVVTISPPGSENGMWAMDQLNFIYSIIYWAGTSAAQTKEEETPYARMTIRNLSPDSTYCLKVRARLHLQTRASVDSPVFCINTTAKDADKLPPPRNVHIYAESQAYTLQWTYGHDNVTFQAQWLHAFFKKIHGNYDDEWMQVPNCEHVNTTQCVFPRNAFQRGLYYFRVRASQGNLASPWSEEKRFDTESQMIIPSPVVTVKAINESSLRVYISSENKPETPDYLLAYEVIFWENTSGAKRNHFVEDRTDFTLQSLKELTEYCVQARALWEDGKHNGSSALSEAVCERTKAGNTRSTWLITVIGAVLAALAILCCLRGLQKLVNYVFFPTSMLPSTINKYVSEQSLRNILLSTAEEQTEKCVVIENVDTVATVEEIHQAEEGHKTYNSQTSQDSGNYSNDDENSSGKASGDLGQEDSSWGE